MRSRQIGANFHRGENNKTFETTTLQDTLPERKTKTAGANMFNCGGVDRKLPKKKGVLNKPGLVMSGANFGDLLTSLHLGNP